MFVVNAVRSQTLICNMGSSCRDEFRAVNGSEKDMWPELADRVRLDRINGERNRLKLNKYQPPLVPTFTEVSNKIHKT